MRNGTKLAVLIPPPHIQPLHFPPARQPVRTRQECPAWHRIAIACASSLESLYGQKSAFAQHLGECSWFYGWHLTVVPTPVCSSCTGAAPRSLSVVLSSVLYHPADYQRIKPLDTHRYADNLANESLRLQFAWTLELAQSQV